MKWSMRLGRVAGILIEIHVTFLFLLAWVALVEYQRSRSWASVVDALAFILAVFASVVLHEYGHALTARRYGVRTRAITILPIGGVASLERIPTRPQEELAIALAGPVVTVLIAATLYLWLRLTGTAVSIVDLDPGGGPFLTRLMWINVFLAGFNLLPAFPMDGGRVLRATLALRWDYVRATRMAAIVGRTFAAGFGLLGLLVGNPFLVFIAIFVWMGAAGEAWNVQLQYALRGLPVERVMIRDLRTVQPGDPLSKVVEYLLAGFQQDFPVVQDSQLVGVLTRNDLLRALAQQGAHTPVRSAMQSEFVVAHPGEPLDEAFARLQGCRCRTMPVVSDGRLLGVLTLDNVGEFFMVHGATAAEHRP
jgi:Zn-dependent protease/CBS domain-containing protein